MFLGGRWPDDAGFDMLDVEERMEEVLCYRSIEVGMNSFTFQMNRIHMNFSFLFGLRERSSWTDFPEIWIKTHLLFTNCGRLQCSQITNCRNQGFMTRELFMNLVLVHGSAVHGQLYRSRKLNTTSILPLLAYSCTLPNFSLLYRLYSAKIMLHVIIRRDIWRIQSWSLSDRWQ